MASSTIARVTNRELTEYSACKCNSAWAKVTEPL